MKRGDIVLALMPHVSGTSAKRRPALVVQADYYNQKIGNVLLATITTNLKRRSDPAHLLIDVSTPEGQQTGLNQNSLVSCINIATLHAVDVGPKIGELPPQVMAKVDDCLRAAFGI